MCNSSEKIENVEDYLYLEKEKKSKSFFLLFVEKWIKT